LIKIKKKAIKIGILGGTFDPPHVGHLHISKVSIKKLNLNKLIWAVTKKNPLKKKPFLKIKERIKLSNKITKNEKKIFIRYYDDKIKSPNTFKLLKYIKKRSPKIDLFFLIGADNLLNLHKWKSWEKIPEFAKIVVFPRNNYLIKKGNYIATKRLKKKDLIYINAKIINISSSLIRKFW